MKLSGNHGDATRGESNIAEKVDVLNRGGAGKDTSLFWCSRRFEWRRRLHGSWGRPDADAELCRPIYGSEYGPTNYQKKRWQRVWAAASSSMNSNNGEYVFSKLDFSIEVGIL